MGRGLRSLEQSLKTRGVRPAPERGQARAPEGASGLSALQEQIEIVRGQRISQPSGSLRALEQRVLGCNVARSAMVPAYVERQTLRLDQEQVAPVQMPYVPDAYPVDVTNAPVTAASYMPHSYSSQGYQHQTPQAYQSPQAYGSQSYAHQSYAPEFSAPDTGRFQVESFADNPFGDDDGDGLSIPAMPAMPTMEDQPGFQMPDSGGGQAPSLMPAQRTTGGSGGNSAPVFDDSDWIAEAQSERPAKVTAASKKSLNPSLALAKNEFERELAAILGTEVAPSAQVPDPLFNPNAAQQPAQTPAAPAKPAAEPEVIHPNHNVFDQMGLAMRYANSFDLGNVSLKDRFEHFEKDLEVDRSTAHRSQPARAQSMNNPFVDPMNLDEFDLVAELAEIGVDAPAVVSQTPQAQPVPPQQTSESQQPIESQRPIESQQPITAPALAPDAAPAKPIATLDPNSPSNKPINRTETTAGDDHE